jgi:Raf kinase inhibitor-like YbhB/YbcL family protein
MAFQITAKGFSEGSEIPKQFTCEGANHSPGLQWSGEPSGTKSFALIVSDPDAPAGVWYHWLLWNIPAHMHSLAEGNGSTGISGINDFGKHGYGGPCPPKGGGTHRYYFRLYALDAPVLDLSPSSKAAALEKAVNSHKMAEAEYMGRYERK